ncbi:hypothetical protein B0H19DRAFT_602685 [Mycena capillaripes]|nr:hypothetical protein B0H19DRAFT_602685 [Mycena capillaripes]
MHDCLQLHNLSRLKSPQMKKLARDISESTGASACLQFLTTQIPHLPAEEAILFLPAIFPHLEPTRIPNPCALDNILSNGCLIPHIDLALQSLTAVGSFLVSTSHVIIPIDASSDLWSCLWPWLDFFHTYWDYLPRVKVMNLTDACIIHSSMILSLAEDDHISKVIRSTPGVRRILATAWKALSSDDGRGPDSFSVVSEIFCILIDGADSSANFEEVVEGVGGNIEDLALTVVQHFFRASSNPTLATTEIFLAGCFGFLLPECAGAVRLDTALHSIGFIPILITTISALHGTDAVGVVWRCFRHLVESLTSPSRIALALDSGLLPMMLMIGAPITVADRSCTDLNRISTLMNLLLDKGLPGALVHYAILVRLKSVCERPQHPLPPQHFVPRHFPINGKPFAR